MRHMAGGQATSTIKRRRIGSLLRKFREEHEPVVLSKAAAAHIKIDATRLGRIERGQYRITPDQISDLLNFLGITDPVTHEELRKAAVEDPTSYWWYAYRKRITQQLLDFVALENWSTKIRTVSAAGVPGLLQAPAYAREMQETSPIEEVRETAGEFFSVRMARQQVINRPVQPAILEALVSEASITASGVTSMPDQIRHLLTIDSQPNVTIQILPNSAPLGCTSMSSFTLMDFDPPWPTTVHLDSPYGGTLDEASGSVERFTQFFSGAMDHALPAEETRGFLQELLRKIEG